MAPAAEFRPEYFSRNLGAKSKSAAIVREHEGEKRSKGWYTMKVSVLGPERIH